ncbi:hypothetical protein [Ramlibacter humi]|uniref:Lipoprotein n=1 Tax=Ramlibacter humi TaxID=2530451 RepID=A0A4Z0BE60_9BURK|nr:hypothetical protein [Ramlibacter humi]TFY97605.1 hypothetical protein EZ216_17915 [Ramlibacter humi]
MSRAAVALALAALASQAMAQDGRWVNATTGKPLQPGIYGRLEMRGDADPPPVVHAQPVTVRRPDGATGEPLYLYVSPGQLRRWPQFCDKWKACERPVYFVRVDGSPSRLGEWKKTQRPQAGLPPVLMALDRIAAN